MMNKKDVKINTRFTPEQIEIMKEFYKENDFTKDIPLQRDLAYEKTDADLFNKASKLFKDYFINNLQDLGVNRMVSNFSSDFPVNVLLNADKDIVGDGVVELKMLYEIFQDEYIDFFVLPRDDGFDPYSLFYEEIEKTSDPYEIAFANFLMNIYRLFDIGYTGYAKKVNKSIVDLTIEEKDIVKNLIIDIFNNELTQFMMLSQQVPELYQISNKDNPTHEDQKGRTLDAKNFYKSWNHTESEKVKEMLSLEQVYENDEDIASTSDFFNGDEDDEETNLELNELKNSFYQTLDETDKAIFSLKEQGYTQAEIAQRLSYKTHSAVGKRIDKMKEQFLEFISA